MDRPSTRLGSPLIERQLESALEALCAALVALESVSETVSEPKRSQAVDPLLGQAIAHLRVAAGELRRAVDDPGAAVVPGFVLRPVKT